MNNAVKDFKYPGEVSPQKTNPENNLPVGFVIVVNSKCHFSFPPDFIKEYLTKSQNFA